ncbi:MAG: prepilin peptidase [Lachnospiraceae bacterium]|nr:prepilin peptidase [Lachnospiraceae bacterium]
MYILIVLFILLAIAVVTDLLFDKVYNEWILIGIACGLGNILWSQGIEGLLWALISMTLPVILLYPLFRIGGLGAGDIKLMAAIGCFLTWKETICCLGIAFFIGAVLSLLKMVAERNFLQRIQYLLSYLRDVFKSGQWKLYEQGIQKHKKEGKIHFSVPILLSVVLYKGGIFW